MRRRKQTTELERQYLLSGVKSESLLEMRERKERERIASLMAESHFNDLLENRQFISSRKDSLIAEGSLENVRKSSYAEYTEDVEELLGKNFGSYNSSGIFIAYEYHWELHSVRSRFAATRINRLFGEEKALDLYSQATLLELIEGASFLVLLKYLEGYYGGCSTDCDTPFDILHSKYKSAIAKLVQQGYQTSDLELDVNVYLPSKLNYLDVIHESIRSHNQRNSNNKIFKNSASELLFRICLNYLRHHKSNYDSCWSREPFKESQAIYNYIKYSFNQSIQALYPDLMDAIIDWQAC